MIKHDNPLGALDDEELERQLKTSSDVKSLLESPGWLIMKEYISRKVLDSYRQLVRTSPWRWKKIATLQAYIRIYNDFLNDVLYHATAFDIFKHELTQRKEAIKEKLMNFNKLIHKKETLK